MNIRRKLSGKRQTEIYLQYDNLRQIVMQTGYDGTVAIVLRGCLDYGSLSTPEQIQGFLLWLLRPKRPGYHCMISSEPLEANFPLSAIARTAAIVASLLPVRRLGLGRLGASLTRSKPLLLPAY
jgi:hypothetical protein